MFQNQQSALPYSAEQQQLQMLNISINTPPYIPQYTGPQPLQNIAGPVAAMVAMELQNNAQRNPLRMFMFNMYAQNNFANNEFSALVVGALDYIALTMGSGQYPSIETCAQFCVPRIVGLACAMLVMQYGALERYIDPSNVNNIRSDIQTFQSICQQIDGMKSQVNRQMNQQQMMGQQNQFSVRSGYNNAPLGSTGNFGVNNNQQQQATGLFSGGVSRGVFGNNAASAGASAGFDRYADENPKHILQQPFAAKPVTQEQPNSEIGVTKVITKEVAANDTDVEWTPSASYPYYPAHNPFMHKLIYTIENNRVIGCKVIDTEPTNMDYERHSLKSVFGPVPKEMDFSNAIKSFDQVRTGVIQLSEAVYDDAEENKDKYDVFVKPGIIAETSLQQAWLNASLERLQNKDAIPDVYRAFALIAEPIVSEKDETEVIKSFGSSKTFIELREKMDSSVNEVSPGLWGSCNMKMTKTINRILKQGMGLPNLSIESFVTDIQDLIEHLGGKNYGEAIQEAFLKYQKDHIAATFQTMYEVEAAELTTMFLDDREFNEKADPKITYLANMYSLTLLNCRSYDLELQLNEGTASIVTKSLCPTMYRLLKGLFDDVEQHPERSMFDRHLIRTTDSRVLECTKGHLGTDAYLLMLIK